MSVYVGKYHSDFEREVFRAEFEDNKTPLDIRHDLATHSDEFNWGYGGSGPAQLALALLADVVGDEKAQLFYQDFKFQVVANWKGDSGWHITDAAIREKVREIEVNRILVEARRLKRESKQLSELLQSNLNVAQWPSIEKRLGVLLEKFDESIDRKVTLFLNGS